MPPSVQKQLPTVAAKQIPQIDMRTVPVLSRIRSISSRQKGMKICIYGETKTGKTRLVSTFPKPILMICTEDGLDSVVGIDGMEWVPIYEAFEVVPLLEMAAQGTKFKTICLDTAGKLSDMVLKDVLGLTDVPIAKTFKMTDRKTWEAIGNKMKEYLKLFLDLADRHMIHVPIVAHERSFKDDDKAKIDAPDRGAALTPSAVGWLNSECDYICQTFKMEETKTEYIDVNGIQEPIETKTGKITYALRVGEDPTWMTGMRVKPGVELPHHIVNPTYEKIVQVIQGKKLT